MTALTIVIPTLGRPQLVDVLKSLLNWKMSLQSELQGEVEFLISHNQGGWTSEPLTRETLQIIENLKALLVKSDKFYDGAELHLNYALKKAHGTYVLPVSDDNSVFDVALNEVLQLALEGKWDWVHFNSISIPNNSTSDPVLNYRLTNKLVDTTSLELLQLIGMNYSICNVARSLVKTKIINFSFWDSLIAKGLDVWSWSAVLVNSGYGRRVCINNMPIHFTGQHAYDISQDQWLKKWRVHSISRSEEPLELFTFGLTKLHAVLLESLLLKPYDLRFAIVQEGKIFKHLAEELLNLTLIQLRNLKSNELGPEFQRKYEEHCNFLELTFPEHKMVISRIRSIYRNIQQGISCLTNIEEVQQIILNYYSKSCPQYLTIATNESFECLKHPRGTVIVKSATHNLFRYPYQIFGYEIDRMWDVNGEIVPLLTSNLDAYAEKQDFVSSGMVENVHARLDSNDFYNSGSFKLALKFAMIGKTLNPAIRRTFVATAKKLGWIN
jgi:hypothetical protein